jgi:hypothetical protein
MNDTEPTYLNLTPNFRVCRCDDRNLELEELRHVKVRPNKHVKKAYETEKWVSIGYYSSLPQAVNGALNAEESNLTAKEKMTLETIVVELTSLSEDLKKAVVESGIKVTDFVKIPDGRGAKPKQVKVAKVTEKPARKTATKKVAKKRGRGRPKKVTT